MCKKCVQDYYLGKKYKKCTTIEGCEVSVDGNNCEECDEYHVLNVKNGKCEINSKIIDENKKYFYKCNRTNEEGNACEKCLDGFVLNDNGLCADNIHCVEEKDGTCKKCLKNETDIYNYCLNSVLGCAEIDIENCLECNDIFDLNKCTKCFEGYLLNDKNKCDKIKEEENNN